MDAFRLHHTKVIEYAIKSEASREFRMNTYGVYNIDTAMDSVIALWQAGYIEDKDTTIYFATRKLKDIPSIKEEPITRIKQPIDILESISKYLCN